MSTMMGFSSRGSRWSGIPCQKWSRKFWIWKDDRLDQLGRSGASQERAPGGRHLLEVHVDGVVQDALAVGFIHHDQSFHLREQAITENKVDPGAPGVGGGIHLVPGGVSLQEKMLSVGEVWEQRSRLGAQGVFPGEASLKYSNSRR